VKGNFDKLEKMLGFNSTKMCFTALGRVWSCLKGMYLCAGRCVCERVYMQSFICTKIYKYTNIIIESDQTIEKCVLTIVKRKKRKKRRRNTHTHTHNTA